jgi:hypothetical protein
LLYRIENSFLNSDGSSHPFSCRIRRTVGVGSVLVLGWILISGCTSLSADLQPDEPTPSARSEKKAAPEVNSAFGSWVDKLKTPKHQKDTHPNTEAAAPQPDPPSPRAQPAITIPDGRPATAPVSKHQAQPLGMQGSLMTVRLPNGLVITKKVVSLREARYKNVIPQKYDLSCGAASLATILNFFYNHHVEEVDIIKHLLEHGDAQEIRAKGFSLLDLKTYALQQGFLADGYKVDLTKVRQLKIPVIILFKSGSYSHFVVLKGIMHGNAYIADPAYGNRSMPIETFKENWNGVIFIVAKPGMQQRAPLPMETTLPAPVLAAMRLKDLFSTGFAGFVSGEF